MIDHIFSSFYYRLIIAFALCLMITFVDKFDLFHTKFITFLLFILILLILYSNMKEDYGLLLLVIALFVLSFNMSFLSSKSQVTNSKPDMNPSAIPNVS